MIAFHYTTAKAVKPDKVRLAILSAMSFYARQVVKEFKKTVSTWEEEVEFQIVKSFPRSGTIEVMVYTDNQKYRWVDEGTAPHDIWAGWYTNKSDKKNLSFFIPNIPKTKPNRLESGLGSTGATHIVTPYVSHPGIRPRNFDKIIAKKMQPIFREIMEEAILSAFIE